MGRSGALWFMHLSMSFFGCFFGCFFGGYFGLVYEIPLLFEKRLGDAIAPSGAASVCVFAFWYLVLFCVFLSDVCIVI